MSEKYKGYMDIPYANKDMENIRLLARKYIEKAVLEERKKK